MTERLRFVLDAYLIGVERGRDYERRFPGQATIDEIDDTERPRARCGCWSCRAEYVGRDVGYAAERGA